MKQLELEEFEREKLLKSFTKVEIKKSRKVGLTHHCALFMPALQIFPFMSALVVYIIVTRHRLNSAQFLR